MLFNSYIFIFLFLPISIIGYFILNRFEKYQLSKLWLIGMSIWFYGCFSIKCLVLLCVSIFANYYLAEMIAKSTEKKGLARGLFIFTLVFNVAILLFFKYTNFFIQNIDALFDASIPFISVVLPMGISFYTFGQLAYIIDIYTGKTSPCLLIDYVTYMTFFGKISQGPIALYDDFIPRLNSEEGKHPNYDNLSKGIYAFAFGLAKKVLIADNLSPVVAAGFDNYANCNSVEIFVAMLCYSFQIYFDFSGYCDMAYGIGLMFNIELPINFSSPYKADSIADFWQRWHATLNKFFTRYIYIPLGGSRKGKAITILNIMIVFLVSGIWHGANWTFILWGILNGLFVVIYRLGRKCIDRIPKIVRVPVTFFITTLLWSIFRSTSVKDSLGMIKRLFTAGYGNVNWQFYDRLNQITEVRVLCKLGLQGLVDKFPWIILVIFMLFCLFAVWFMKNTEERVRAFKPDWKRCLVFVVLMILGVLSLSSVTEFIYFNF